MKVVIIGGGIAGISCGILLHNKGMDVVINERDTNIPTKGNAFLMHADGLSILKEFAHQHKLNDIPGKVIDTFILKRPDETEIKYLKLEPWQSIKRKDIIDFLYALIPSDKIKTNRTFSHFLYKEEKAVAAVFKNGDIEEGDIFIGAGGTNSAVREAIFGTVNFINTEVKEIVGVLKHPYLVNLKSNVFNKYHSREIGLSFGYIPTSEEEMVWYLQYDTSLYNLQENTPEALKELCVHLTKDFPSVVHQIVKLNDYNTTYLWHARDFDLLPSFHKNNVVLIGDAAHVALPFTSAGTTNALVDAQVITEKITTAKDIESAFNSFYEERAPLIAEHLMLGRELKNKFLHPGKEEDDELKVPLIAHKKMHNLVEPKTKRIHLLYFTDPVCSTCWIIQPQLRKLKMEYENYIETEYCMGGLLPYWENYKSGSISKPEDAYDYWDYISKKHDMPIFPDVWKDNPLPSYYAPSIAFKAAQLQNTDKAIIFLRRINEMLFFENKNIVENVLLHIATFESGLDAALLIRDLEGKAQLLFEADLLLAQELNINTLPTFVFTYRFNNSKILKGFQEYECFEKMLLEFVTDATKSPITKRYNKIFKKYPTLSTQEFAFLTDKSIREADEIMFHLLRKGIVCSHSIKNEVIIWKLNSIFN